MLSLETAIVALLVLGAAAYVVRSFCLATSGKGDSCGCGVSTCPSKRDGCGSEATGCALHEDALAQARERMTERIAARRTGETAGRH